MAQLYTRRNIVIVFILCFLLLAFFGLYSFNDMRQVNRNSARANQIIQSLSTIEEILDDLQEIESGQRGFVISGKESFLDNYDSAMVRLREDTLSIKLAASRFPLYSSDYRRLLDLVNEKVNFAIRTVQVRRDTGQEASIELVQSERGKILMDSIHLYVQKIETASRVKLAEINKVRVQASRSMSSLFIILSTISVLVLSGLFYQIYKGLVNREKYERQIDHLAKLTQSTSDAIISLDTTGIIQSWNKGAERIYGYREEEVIGKFAPDITKSGFTLQGLKNLKEELADKEITNLELLQYHRDGTAVHCLTSVSPVKNDKGEVTGFVSVLRDITIRKNLEEQLRRFNVELAKQVDEKTLEIREMFESISDAFIGLDENLRYVYINGRAAQMLRKDPKEMIGRHLLDEFPEVRDTGLYQQLLTAMKTQRPIKTELHASNQSYWLNLSIYPSPRGVSFYFQDITEKKNSEEKLRLLQQQFTSFMETIPAMAWILDDKGTMKYMNPAYMEAFTSGQNLTGKNIRDIYLGEPNEDYLANDRKVIEEDRAIESIEPMVYGETKKILQVFKFPLGDPDGRKLMGGIAIDVTGIKEAQEKLQKLNEELAISNRELEQFAYIASHDLQEPLRMVSSFLQLLQKKYGEQLDEKAKQYIGFAVDGAERMKRLISDLLNFSRVGTSAKNIREVDMNKVFEDVEATLESAINESGARISSTTLPVIKADQLQMQQLLQNLVGNAIKYRSEKEPKIEISCQDETVEWIFSIRDNGIGFDKNYHDKIFTIFQRLHTRTEFSGTGIGLAICKKIVERHQGRIWADSTPGEGSVFYFSIGKELK